MIFLLETLAGYIELIKSLQNFRYVNDKLATLQLVRDRDYSLLSLQRFAGQFRQRCRRGDELVIGQNFDQR